MVDNALLQPISFTVEVKIIKVEDKKATIKVPSELRLTQGLLNYLHAALAERELELSHMEISETHKKEVESLTNVVVQDPEKK